VSRVEDWIARASTQAAELVDRALDRQLRLAVTGLSQSGKTAFITALVNQLEHACSPDARLTLWKACERGRLLGVRRVPQVNAHIPSFAYETACARLFGTPPAWPESTRGVSEIRLEIRYRPTGRWARDIGTLYLDIVDYPGEWLLDLPLLRWRYAEWSREIARTLDSSPRMAALAAAWTQWSPAPDAPFDEQAVARVAAVYTAWLRECREQLGLSLLQPGRFLLPGEYAGAPMLQFLPWIWDPPAGTPADGSLYATLERRYEQYLQHLVRGFYREHFAGFDRQIVLVDCLHALEGGQECFEDTGRALQQIIRSFSYGQGNFLDRLFRPRIDRVLFAASKADHVLPEDHPHLVSLLQRLVRGSADVSRFEGVPSDCMALASVSATEVARGRAQGELLRGLRGTALDGTPLLIHPQELPPNGPDAHWWEANGEGFDRFRPLVMEPSRPMPHIRMDAAIEFLIGDRLN